MALSVDKDLDAVWHEVIAKINEKTNLFPSDAKLLPECNINDVINKITPPDKSEHGHKAKTVFKNVLLVLQRFGDVIGDATAAVFEPSKQCINAINILIISVQKTAKFFDDAVVLLERVCAFLDQLRFWFDKQDSLDVRLRKHIYKVLEHFIDIVALTNKLASSRREKVKVFARAFAFGEDSRIIAALATLETRVVDVTRIQIAVICKDLGEAALDVRELRSDMELMLQNDAEHAEVLGSVDVTVKRIDDRLIDNEDLHFIRNKAGQYANGMRWRDEHASLGKYTRPGTGEWLFERHDFQDWLKSGSLFLVKGGPGRGRSSLAYAIIEHLKKQNVVYYHYLKRWAPGSSQGLESALSVIWQVAERDRDYRQFVRKSNVNWSDKVDLWQKLILAYPKPLTILVDNVDDISPQWTFGRVLANLHTSKVRLCLLGPLQGIDKYHMPRVVLDGDSLKAGPDFPNARDVALFIDHRLNKSLEFEDQRERIKSTLLQHIQNDFTTLYPVLDSVGSCTSIRQLNAVLAGTAEKAIDRIESMIERLNHSLSQGDIIELNAVLSWLSFASEDSTSIKILQQYLAARGKPSQRLNKYKYVLEQEDDHIAWRDEQIRVYLQSRSEFERLAQRRHRLAVDPEEAELVKTIIRTNLSQVLGVKGQAIYNDYGFDQFFREKMGLTTARIRLDQGQSHVIILDACLSAITIDIRRQDLHHFRSYAYAHLHDHLERADISTADSQTCQAIAIKLAQLLSSKDVMLAFWNHHSFSNGIAFNVCTEHYLRWLQWIDDIPAMHEAKSWYKTISPENLFDEILTVGQKQLV